MKKKICPKCGKRSLEVGFVGARCRKCGYQNKMPEKQANLK